ncbi:MAG: tetratricopeptide repeat protein [Pseudonocardiaceae bacterium]|nr:tetratricopeptide repeat protein [Pseudonocardiaceae bacterium]
MAEHGQTERWRAEFRLLGAVEIRRDGHVVRPLAAQPACVLAVLLLGAGDVVSTDRLIDAVWGERAPDDARNAVQVYVSRLRRILAGADNVRVTTAGHHGYRMDVPAGDVDLYRFRSLAKQADGIAADDADAALALLEEAVALWRGVIFDGAAGDWLHRQLAPALVDEQRRAREQRARLLGTVARDPEAIAELSALLAEYPTRESVARELMAALHRDGRTAEALAVFSDLRTSLVDELGIEPGAEVRACHEAILADTTADETAGDTDPVAVPAQLPGDVPGFVGRAEQIQGVVDHLAEQADLAKVVLIAGAGGAGKSALAARLGHTVRGRYREGQLYAHLGGRQPAEPADVLAGFLGALGVPDSRIPVSTEQRAALFRSIVAERDVLVVLDDATSAEQVRPLLPGTARCAVLVTSRSRLATLDATYRVTVGGLTDAEAVELLTTTLGAERADAEPEALRRVITLCGNVPLALRVSAARMTNRPGWRIAELADRLSDEHARLDQLRLGDLDVRASFTLSYAQLAPGAARAFRLLALAEATWLTETATATMLDVAVPAADEVLDPLIDLHLLDLIDGSRLRIHDLLRQFGRELASSSDAADAADDARARLAAWYVHSAEAAIAAAVPGARSSRLLLPAPPHHETFTATAAAVRWLESERANIAAVVCDAASRGLVPPSDLVRVASSFGRYAGPRGHLASWRKLAEAALTTARRFRDHRSEARAMVTVGALEHREHELDDAATHLRAAARELADSGGPTAATAMNNLAHVYEALQQRSKVLEYVTRAHDIYVQVGDRRGQANTLTAMARQRSELGDHAEAESAYRQAIGLATDAGAVDVAAGAHAGLADVLSITGKYADAHRHYQTALRQIGGSHNRWLEGVVLAGLGRLYSADGRLAQAVDHFERAATAYRDGAFTFELAITMTDLGHALIDLGQGDRGAACLHEVAELTTTLAPPHRAHVQAHLDHERG